MMISSNPNPLVSVIIPCYNHGKYLTKAIESILMQNYTHHEIIVVDDGSTDNTREVAQRYKSVKYIYQQNQGLSAARNIGIDNSNGSYLVFLDADDWLFREALSINLHYLNYRQEAAFVSGAFTDISMHYGRQTKEHIGKDHYYHLLERNYIAMHATVMYRRWVFDSLRYDTSLKACEDYDIYLKVARDHPVIHHTKQIAVYNRHDGNMSGNYPMMLEYALIVLKRQKECLKDAAEIKFFERGLKFWIDHYCENIYAVLGNTNQDKSKNESQLETLKKYRRDLYLKHKMTKRFMWIKKSLIKRNFNFIFKALSNAGLYRKYIPAPGKIAMGDFNRVTPFSTNFGYERGGPVDRYYIENFLKKQSSLIYGRILEIGDNEYTIRFGGSNILKSDILHIDSSNEQATFVGDLSNAPHLPSDSFDCIILTQTLQMIYEYKAALQTCFRVLKPGGALLLTVPGISHIDQGEWKKVWLYSFTESSITRVLSEIFPVDKVEVETYGNVLVATSFLYGVGLPELTLEQMDFNDPHYQVIISATAIKPV
jgi:glycosyltransferase involved in cell wall biosynthesis